MQVTQIMQGMQMNAIVIKEISGAHSLKKEKFYIYSGKIKNLIEIDEVDVDKVQMVSDGGIYLDEYSQHHGVLLRGRKIRSIFKRGLNKYHEICVFVNQENLLIDINGKIFYVEDIKEIRIYKFILFGYMKIQINDNEFFSFLVVYPFWLSFWDDGQDEQYQVFPFFFIMNELKNKKRRFLLKRKLINGYFFEADWIKPISKKSKCRL